MRFFNCKYGLPSSSKGLIWLKISSSIDKLVSENSITWDPKTSFSLRNLIVSVSESKTTETFPAMAMINLYSIQYDDDLVFCRLGVDTIGNTTDECNLQSFVHGGDLESMCDTSAVL